MTRSSEPQHKQHAGKHSEASPWEWVVAAAGTILVLTTTGFLLYEGIVSPSTPPQIELVVDTVEEAAGGYVVTFWAHNYGQTTAAGLLVEGGLRHDTTTIETSSVTLSYVPSEGRRQAGLFFSHDPRQYEIEIKPKGYERP